MTSRTTITLDPRNLAFLDSMAAGNRSAYINFLIRQEKKRRLTKAIRKANIEEANDEEYQKEYALWEATLMDGLQDESKE